MNTTPNTAPAGKEISQDLREALILIGRGLGTIAVYGMNHPSTDQMTGHVFTALQQTLKNGDITLGSFNGALTVNEEPVSVKDLPIRTLEKRLVAMKVSHLALHSGLTKEELKQLLQALCESSAEKMKETISSTGSKHIALEEVTYVTLRNGETKTGSGGGGKDIPQTQLNQINAFLKGKPELDASTARLKKAISDPEKLGEMILEAAKIQQKTESMGAEENLADLVVGGLRRTYDGLRKESVFESAQGKATLAKTMLLVEKTILNKIQSTGGEDRFELDRRIRAGIRKRGKEQQLDMLSTHYAEQCLKQKKTEKILSELIRQLGPEKAREQLMASNIPVQDWQRLMAQNTPSPQPANANVGDDDDIRAIATVLDKLDGFLQLAERNPAAAKNTVQDAQQGINEYTLLADAKINRIKEKIQKSQVQDRDKLILEISKLTLSLMQPLTVINGSLEAAIITADAELHKELLDLALQSGQSLDAMTKRMIELTNYPELNEADDHLNEWH